METPTLPPIGRFIDPLTDFGFKLLFGSEPNKELLIAFLNELLRNRRHIKDLAYNKNEHHGPRKAYRKSLFDVTCTDDNGIQFIIEVQRAYQEHFIDRAIYYTSTLFHEKGPKGKTDWNYELPEVYLVALLDCHLKDCDGDNCIHWVQLTEEQTGKVFYKKLAYIFIEIPRFNKQESELETDLDRWLFLLKNLSIINKIPVILHKRIFLKLFALAEVTNLSIDKYRQYMRNRMARWTEYAILETAKKEGLKEGAEQKTHELVKNMLASGKYPIPEIASLAGVTQAFVRQVKKTLQ